MHKKEKIKGKCPGWITPKAASHLDILMEKMNNYFSYMILNFFTSMQSVSFLLWKIFGPKGRFLWENVSTIINVTLNWFQWNYQHQLRTWGKVCVTSHFSKICGLRLLKILCTKWLKCNFFTPDYNDMQI